MSIATTSRSPFLVSDASAVATDRFQRSVASAIDFL
jgi:hypothetical protein